MQSDEMTLWDSRLVFDTLLESIEEGKEALGNPFYNCKFSGKRIILQGTHSLDYHFESSVVKTQRVTAIW